MEDCVDAKIRGHDGTFNVRLTNTTTPERDIAFTS